MSIMLGLTVLKGVTEGIRMIRSLRGGSPEDAVSAVERFQETGLREAGVPDEVCDIIEWCASGMSYVSRRQVEIKDAKALIINAVAEGRDLTDDEVEQRFARTDSIAERVRAKNEARKNAT